MKKNRHYCSALLIFIFLAGFPSFALAIAEEEMQDLYSQAKDFFRKGIEADAADPNSAKEFYKKAVMRFERIAGGGKIRNGKLFYNIGNVYFRMGNLGQTILNYRRAEKYIPNDPNLRQNLDYARSRRHDKVEEKPQTRALKALLFWHYDFSSKTRSTLFGIFFTVFWIGGSIRLFFPKFMSRWVLMVTGIVAALFLASLLAENILEKRNQAGVILAEEIIARKGDGESYQPSFKEPLHEGTEFKLIEMRENWLQIELHDGRRCWIPGKDAGIV